MTKKIPVVVVDLDGTLCDTSSVLHHVKGLPRDKKNYDAFHEGSRHCPPIKMVQDMVAEDVANGLKVVIATGRKERWRALSHDYTEEHLGAPYIEMYMRPDDDHRSQVEFKTELIGQLVEQYDIKRAYEDRQAVVDVWRSHGIPVVHIEGEEI